MVVATSIQLESKTEESYQRVRCADGEKGVIICRREGSVESQGTRHLTLAGQH
jgi:hypothetical protein